MMTDTTRLEAPGAATKMAVAALRDRDTRKTYGRVDEEFETAGQNLAVYAISQGKDIGWAGRALVAAGVIDRNDPVALATQENHTSAVAQIAEKGGLAQFVSDRLDRVEEVMTGSHRGIAMKCAALRQGVRRGAFGPAQVGKSFLDICRASQALAQPEAPLEAARGYAAVSQAMVTAARERSQARGRDDQSR